MEIRCEPTVVSVQRLTATDAVDGHLAWGLLIDRDRVAIPGPLEWLHDLTVRFEVLLASARGGDRGVVERIAVEHAELFGLRGQAGGAAAVLQLTHPARHRESRGGRFDSEAVATRVGAHGDVWKALEEVGVVPQDLRDRQPGVILLQVVKWEKTAREDLIRDRLSPTSDPVFPFCCFWACVRCNGCPGQWW